jgi:hypothetical protein
MAARENQGLQIALIVFVMLTIMLSVSTFLFFRNYQNATKQAEEANKKASDAEAERGKQKAERDLYVKYIGFPDNSAQKEIDDAHAADFALAQTFGIATPEDQKNYRKLVENYQAHTKSLNTQIADKDNLHKVAKATFDQKMAEADKKVADITKEKEDAVAAYTAQEKKREEQINTLTKSKDDLLAEKDKAVNELATLKAATDTEINKLKEEIAKKDETIRDKNILVDGLRGIYDVNAAPDGRVIWVNQREGVAVINLGTADNLRKRITFSVFDPGTTDVSALKSDNSNNGENKTPASLAVTKGSIEVINITDRHMAECRILQHSPSNPIVPGDVISTPVWQPGQENHFAFAGTIDIDGDGEDDLQRVIDIVRVNGGAVDTEVNVGTRYIVVGKVEEKEGADSSKKLTDAKTFGIQHIKLSQFLEMMGYSAKASEGVIKPGEGMTYPKAGEPTGKFRPRTPPSRPAATSAFGERGNPEPPK